MTVKLVAGAIFKYKQCLTYESFQTGKFNTAVYIQIEHFFSHEWPLFILAIKVKSNYLSSLTANNTGVIYADSLVLLLV